ncbi:hypothetical protein HK097_001396, partial [Rhizophlyctis rosea]
MDKASSNESEGNSHQASQVHKPLSTVIPRKKASSACGRESVMGHDLPVERASREGFVALGVQLLQPTKSQTKEKGPRAAYLESLRQRIHVLEQALHDQAPTEGDSPELPHILPPAPTKTRPDNGPRYHPPSISPTISIPRPLPQVTTFLAAVAANPIAFPKITLDLCNQFFDNFYMQGWACFMHRAYVMQNLPAIPTYIVQAMCAIGARYTRIPEVVEQTELPYQRGEPWCEAARRDMIRLVDEPSVDGCGGLVLMGYAAATSLRRLQRSIMYQHMAQRMAIHLRMNIDPDTPQSHTPPSTESWLEREKRRRIWWSVKFLERILVASGRIDYQAAQFANEQNDNVRVPAPEALWEAADPVSGELPNASLASYVSAGPSDAYQCTMSFLAYFGRPILRFRDLCATAEESGTNESISLLAAAENSELAMEYLPQLDQLDSSLQDWFHNLIPPIRNLENVRQFGSGSLALTNQYGERAPWLL